MKVRRPRINRVLVDVLLSVMAIVLIMINIPRDADVQSKADFSIEVEWTIGDVDIDTWIMIPDGSMMSFKNKDIGYATIDRDDLGNTNDPSPSNFEIVSLRAPIDGTYYISIHNFRGSSNGNIWITIRKISNGSNRVVTSTVILIPPPKMEVPLFALDIVNNEIVSFRNSTRYIIEGARR